MIKLLNRFGPLTSLGSSPGQRALLLAANVGSGRMQIQDCGSAVCNTSSHQFRHFSTGNKKKDRAEQQAEVHIEVEEEKSERTEGQEDNTGAERGQAERAYDFKSKRLTITNY